MNFKNLKEVQTGLLTKEEVSRLLNEEYGMSFIEHPQNPLLLGSHALLKVNTNIGVSDSDCLDDELKKLDKISGLKYAPDSIMDHTIVDLKKPLWKYMVEMLHKPIGTLPHYTTYRESDGIDKNRFLEKIIEMAEGGISFMTLHPTSSLRLLDIANKNRSISTTSRGGVIVLRDAQINKRNTNVIVDNFDEIINVFKKYNMTMSIGTTFRPARIDEALDAVQLDEIKLQKEYITYVKAKGVNVIMEGVGHIALRDIAKYCELIRDINTPIMPLGPMPTDATIGFDHVTSAIGSTVISMSGNVALINSVTREEHTGGVPRIESIIEGLKTARTVAHCINLLRFESYSKIDRTISEKRAYAKSCVINGGIFDDGTQDYSENEGCARCCYECPLSLLK